jgi:L-asparaginase
MLPKPQRGVLVLALAERAHPEQSACKEAALLPNSSIPSTRQQVAVIALGGTIAMRAVDPHSGAVPDDSLTPLLEDAAFSGVTFTRLHDLPSCEIGFDHLLELARVIEDRFREGCPGIVVTTGTDTLEEVAFALELLVRRSGPVIVTGAMRYANAIGADGPVNLLSAIIAAREPALTGAGVLVCMNEELYPARYTRKTATHGHGFQSVPVGPVARVIEGRILVQAELPPLPLFPIAHAAFVHKAALICAAFDDDGAAYEHLLHRPVPGLVVEALGGGHVSGAVRDVLEKLAQSIPVVIASRTGYGPTLSASYGYRGGDIDLRRIGTIGAGLFDARKARVALTIMLTAGCGHEEIAAFFAP